MKLCLGSDIHGNVRSLKYFIMKSKSVDCNLILLAGDLSSWKDQTSIFNVLKELNSSGIITVGVLGNSDYENDLELMKDYENISILHGNSITIDDITIIGVSGIPNNQEHGSYFSLPDSKILKFLTDALNNSNRNKYLISITHVPPINILDLTKNNEHIGSKSVRVFIERYHPDLHLCGHVHESEGIEKFNNTIIVNPGIMEYKKQIYYAELEESEEKKIFIRKF